MATLKVRVRAASGGPTMRVQVPWPFTVQALKDVISPLIMQPTSSFSLSLNKKVAIDGPGTALLSDFGIINGDLLFYIATQRDSSAAPQPADFPFAHSNEEVATELASTSAPSTSCSPINGKTVEDHGLKGNSTRREAEGFTSLTHEDSSMSLISSSTNFQQKSYAPASLEGACISQNQETVVPMHDAPIPTSMEPTLAAPTDQEVKNVQSAMQFSGDNAMEVEIEEKGGLQSPVEIEKYRVFIPDLLQHVLSIEYQNVKQQQELLVLAVHAVMLETGFVLSGEISSSQGPYGLPTGWSGKGGQVNLTYTLPEIKRESEDAGSHSFVEDMILRCQIVGNTLVVYGVTTSGRGCEVHRVSLPVSSFLNEESVLKGSGSAGNGLMGTKPSAYQAHNVTEQHATNMDVIGMFHNVFELWKEVKDKLSLPLLTCLCERAGLPPPASLLIIPTELKMKVLELLPAIALARIGCVCLELKFLAGSDDLWKIRFKEEFGGVVLGRTSGLQGWKKAFADEWSRRKRWEQKSREADRHMRVPAFGVRIRPRPYVPHFPGVIGYQEKFYFNPGDTGFKVFKTKFATIGIGICWDQWFPEMARALVLMGAEVLFYPTAIGTEPQDAGLDSSAHWRRVMQGHAGANVVPLVASNRVGQEVIQTEHGPSKITFYGTSFIAGATGEIVQSADGESDTVLVARFDLNQIKVKRHSWGVFRDRRPELYKVLLTSDGKTETPSFSSTAR